QLLELVLVSQRIHRLPETCVLVSAELAVAGQSHQRIAFPRCVIALNVVDCSRLKDEKPSVDPCSVAGWLLGEARDAEVFDAHSTIPAGRLNGSQRRQLS